MAKLVTNLRKMRTSLDDVAQYILPIYDNLDQQGTYYMNPLVGMNLTMRFTGDIHCIATGKKIKKTFGEGLSYDAWLKSPMAVESIVRPELSRIHEGIALRDFEWEQEHHNQPHYVYLSKTSGVKVGVTRVTNVPSRWIDQGATEAIILAETPYRQLAGLIEVALKEHFADKTAWQAMLKNTTTDDHLVAKKEEAMNYIADAYEAFFYDDDTITSIAYPVISFPDKVKSMKADTMGEFKGKLMGIKGQYMIFEGGFVFNVRSHAGYRMEIEFEE